nr:hypothetical protein [Tanacetum cinerariifolium]
MVFERRGNFCCGFSEEGFSSVRFSDSFSSLRCDCSLISGKKKKSFNQFPIFVCFYGYCEIPLPFAGLSGCHDGGCNGLTKTYLNKHLHDRHCNSEAQAITKHSLLNDLVVFERAEVTLKRMGIWLCGVCFKTHTLRTKCRHGTDIVPPPNIGDGVVRFVLYDFTKPLVPSCSQLDHGDGLLHDHDGFTLSLLDNLFSKDLRTVKSIPPKCHLGFSPVLKGALDKVICKSDDISCWVNLKRESTMPSDLGGVPGGSLQLVRETLAESASPMLGMDEEDLDLSERNLKQCKRKICDGHYTAAVRVLSSYGVAPYKDATLQELKAKHPFKSALSLPDIPIHHHQLIASQALVLDRIKSFPQGTSCGQDGLRAQHLMDCLSGAAVAISDELISSITKVVNPFLDGKCPMMLGEYISSAPLTPLVKPGGGIRPIVVGTVWRRLVSKVSAIMVVYSLGVYLDDLQFGVGISGGGEAILQAVNRLVEDRGDEVGLSMLLVDFQNAFNMVDRKAWYIDDGTIVGDTLVVGKVLELITVDGPRCGLHLNVGKTEIFWPKEDPRCRVEGAFPPNISRPLHGVKLLGGDVSMDFGLSSELVMKRVSKTIELMDVVAKINDPQCDLLLLRACTGMSKLYFAMRTCPPCVFESAQRSFDVALRSALERIVTTSGPGFGNWKWRLPTLPFAFGGLGVYSADDVLNYAFLASRLQSAALQTKLLRHVDIVASGPTFDDALNIYFTRVTKDAISTFSLSSRQMALWQSQMEDHTSDWLRAVPISVLGQNINGRTYRCVLCYRLGVPLFSVTKSCLTCSRIYMGDIYGDHALLCDGIVGIKHQHNVVRDTLVDICYRSGISSGKEVDIGLGGERDKSLRPADVLLYSWDGGRDICVDLTGSSPLTQTGMADFVPGRVVLEAAQRKRAEYDAKCADIGYGFLPFSFSSIGELKKDAVTLLKPIRKFSVAQDIGTRAAIHIFSRINFAIAKGVGA